MATTEPLTGARIPTDSDGPLGGSQIARAIQDIADETLPRYTTSGARDTAYANWVAAGHTMYQGLHCVVNGRLNRFNGSSWETVAGYRGRGTTFPTDAVVGDTYWHDTYACLMVYNGSTTFWRQVTAVETTDHAAWRSNVVAAGLVCHNGFQVYNSVTDRMYAISGSGSTTLSPTTTEDWTNGSLDYPNSAIGRAWQAYQSYIWDPILGAKVTIPADGVARTVLLNATTNMAGDGWMRIRADVGSGAGTPSYWPNATGKRSITTGGQEQGVSMMGRLKLDGTQQAVIYLEAKATTQGSMDMLIPQLMITATS